MGATKRIRGGLWKHKNYKTKFRGSYAYAAKGDRYFKLLAEGAASNKVYESPRAAQQSGWKLVSRGQ